MVLSSFSSSSACPGTAGAGAGSGFGGNLNAEGSPRCLSWDRSPSRRLDHKGFEGTGRDDDVTACGAAQAEIQLMERDVRGIRAGVNKICVGSHSRRRSHSRCSGKASRSLPLCGDDLVCRAGNKIPEIVFNPDHRLSREYNARSCSGRGLRQYRKLARGIRKDSECRRSVTRQS